MKADERIMRDAAIMKLVRAKVDPRTIARKHRLTVTRVNQIIERDRTWRRKKTKRKVLAAPRGKHRPRR